MPSYYVPSSEKISQLEELLASLNKEFSNSIIDSSFANNEVSITLKKESLIETIQELRDSSKYLFKQLIDITAVDYLERTERFELVYLLLSLANNVRLKIKVNITEIDIVDSLNDVYTNSDWLEREVYDMFGIYFKGHKDLRRILTDFGFEGSPLRKDFPLTGFVEVEFNEEYQKVMYKPVELTQAYRDYSSNNPWIEDMQADIFDYLNKNKED